MATFNRPSIIEYNGASGDWSHNTNNSDFLGSITGGTADEYLVSITLQMGTGIGTFTHTSGNSTTGEGNPIRIRLKIGETTDTNLYSDIVTLTHQTVSGSRTYATYTFTFPTRVKILANTTYRIWYSDVGGESNNVICCKNGNENISGVTSPNATDNQMYIYHNGAWCPAKKYIYHTPVSSSTTDTPSTDTSESETEEHVHTQGEVTIMNRIEPTCGADGSYYTSIRCATCNARTAYYKTVIPATGLHTFVTENGVESMYCLTCGTSNPNFNPDTV